MKKLIILMMILVGITFSSCQIPSMFYADEIEENTTNVQDVQDDYEQRYAEAEDSLSAVL
mgnify:CR=1 FL=1